MSVQTKLTLSTGKYQTYIHESNIGPMVIVKALEDGLPKIEVTHETTPDGQLVPSEVRIRLPEVDSDYPAPLSYVKRLAQDFTAAVEAAELVKETYIGKPLC